MYGKWDSIIHSFLELSNHFALANKFSTALSNASNTFFIDKRELPVEGNLAQCATMDEISEGLWNTVIRFGVPCETIEREKENNSDTEVDFWRLLAFASIFLHFNWFTWSASFFILSFACSKFLILVSNLVLQVFSWEFSDFLFSRVVRVFLRVLVRP